MSVSKNPLIGDKEFSFEGQELDEEFQAIAAKELRETPKNVEEGLERLRELLKGEPDLKVPTDKDFLQRFLRPCKWYPDSAFNLMKRFYKYKQTHPRYCKNLIPSNEEVALLCGCLTPMPTRMSDGCRIFILQGGRKWKPKEVTLDQMFRGVILFLLALIAEPKSQVGGVRVIIDMDGLSISQVTYFTPSFAGAVVDFVQRCLPCRLKGIHIINQPFIFNMVFAFFKPFLQEKLRKRIHFHGSDKSSLLSCIEPGALPKRYGGVLDIPTDVNVEPLFKYVCEHEEEFKVTDKQGYVTEE